jgi:hypothetical protein
MATMVYKRVITVKHSDMSRQRQKAGSQDTCKQILKKEKEKNGVLEHEEKLAEYSHRTNNASTHGEYT